MPPLGAMRIRTDIGEEIEHKATKVTKEELLRGRNVFIPN